MKNFLLLFAILFGISFTATSSHGVGGDIQYTQTGSNSYDVTMRLFRYCNPGAATLGSNYTIDIADQVTCVAVTTVGVQRDTFYQLNFGDECYTPPGLCVEVHEYSGTIAFLANNPNGYITTWDLCCRNTVTNVAPGSLGLYTKIPDPALTAGNSTPRFVDYPSDGYFCIGQKKCIDFSATDADGDSLAYFLVNPINNFSSGPCTPNLLRWNSSFDLTNILGPGSCCTIDSKTGCVWARPAQLGLYVISVKCVEYRNGVAIGETVRDIQYAALNCNINELPNYYGFEEIQVLQFDETGCFDVAAFDNDPEDTFFIDVLSSAFQYGAVVSLPPANTSGLYDFKWLDTSGTTDTINNVNVKKLTSTKFEGIGRVGVRFCWTTDQCDILAIDTFDLNMYGYSLGCDGSVDSIEKTVKIVVEKPTSNYIVPNVFSPNDDKMNDEFKLKLTEFNRCYDVLYVKIYNRWGQLVYESDKPQFSWNGRAENGEEVAEGTYFVVLGGVYGGKEVTQNFPLTIFR